MANTISTKEFKNRVVTKLKNVNKNIKAEDLYFNQTLKYRCIAYKPNYPEQSLGDFWTSQRRQASRGKGSKNVSCSLRIWREIGRLERKLERKEREQRATHTRLVLVKQMR